MNGCIYCKKTKKNQKYGINIAFYLLNKTKLEIINVINFEFILLNDGN